jgi:hypothetical protein
MSWTKFWEQNVKIFPLRRDTRIVDFYLSAVLSLSAADDSYATKTLRSGRPHLALAINVNNYILLVTFYNHGRAWK